MDRGNTEITLTKREHSIAELIAWGATDKETAQELFISHETVRTHRRNILKKIGGHNTADITRWYFTNKIRQIFEFNPRRVNHIPVIDPRQALKIVFGK